MRNAELLKLALMKRERFFMAVALLAVAVAVLGCPGGGTTPPPDPPPQDIVLRPDITVRVAVGNELLSDSYSMNPVVHQSILVQGPLPENISYLLPLVAVDGDGGDEAQSRLRRLKTVYKLMSGTFDKPTVGSEVIQEYFVTYDSGGNATIRDRLGIIVNPDSILDGLLVVATLRVVNCIAWDFAIGLPICNPWLKDGPLMLEYIDDGPAPKTWPLTGQTLLGRLGSDLDKNLTKSQTLTQPMVEVLPSTRWLCEARVEVEFEATLSGHTELEFFDVTFLMDWDRDGISNEQEIIDGTNPFDPLDPAQMVLVPSVIGADPVNVPGLLDVVGLVQNPVLAQAQYSTTIANGLVVWQSPIAGASVLSGSAVQIALSLGPPPTADLSMAFTSPTAGVHVASGTTVRFSLVITNGVAPFLVNFLPPTGNWMSFVTYSRTAHVDVTVSSTAGPGPSTESAYAEVIDQDGLGTLFPPADQDPLSVSIVVDSPPANAGLD